MSFVVSTQPSSAIKRFSAPRLDSDPQNVCEAHTFLEGMARILDFMPVHQYIYSQWKMCTELKSRWMAQTLAAQDLLQWSKLISSIIECMLTMQTNEEIYRCQGLLSKHMYDMINFRLACEQQQPFLADAGEEHGAKRSRRC
jgi:hypothetical protein